MLWTEGQKRGLTINQIVRLISTNPAKLCGLDNKKGALKCGYDADFVVWNPNESFKIYQKDIEHKNKVSFLEDPSTKNVLTSHKHIRSIEILVGG